MKNPINCSYNGLKCIKRPGMACTHVCPCRGVLNIGLKTFSEVGLLCTCVFTRFYSCQLRQVIKGYCHLVCQKVEKYSAKSPSFNKLEVNRKQKQPILCTVLNASICRFLYIKKNSEKKILYTNLYMANIVQFYSFLIRSPIKKIYQ